MLFMEMALQWLVLFEKVMWWYTSPIPQRPQLSVLVGDGVVYLCIGLNILAIMCFKGGSEILRRVRDAGICPIIKPGSPDYQD